MRTRATASGVEMTVETDGLVPGHSYTMWVMFANHPERCLTPPGDGFSCGAIDHLANPAAGASTVYGGGIPSATGDDDRFEAFVAASSLPSDVAGLVGYTRWRVKNSMSPVGGLAHEQIANGTGLLVNPLGAEYQTTLVDHGPYDPEQFGEAQWTMHDGGCHIEDGEVWPFMMGPCSQMQAAGFVGLPPWIVGSNLGASAS